MSYRNPPVENPTENDEAAHRGIVAGIVRDQLGSSGRRMRAVLREAMLQDPDTTFDIIEGSFFLGDDITDDDTTDDNNTTFESYLKAK